MKVKRTVTSVKFGDLKKFPAKIKLFIVNNALLFNQKTVFVKQEF
jgi:hypothetical protein